MVQEVRRYKLHIVGFTTTYCTGCGTKLLDEPGMSFSRVVQSERRRTTAQSAESVQASGKNDSWTPACGGVLGKSNCVEATGQTQNMLEGLCSPSGLGMPQDPPGRTGGCG